VILTINFDLDQANHEFDSNQIIIE